MAAKWPAAVELVGRQCADDDHAGPAKRRMGGAISRGKTATPVGTVERAAGLQARAREVS